MTAYGNQLKRLARNGQLAGGIPKLALATYAATLVTFASAPILARALGPGGRGELASVLVYAGLLASIAGLGLPSGVAFWVAKGRAEPHAILGVVLRYVALSSLLLSAFSVAIVSGPLRDLSSPVRLPAILLLSLSAWTVMTYCLQAVLIAQGALGALAVTRVIPALATLMFVVFASSRDMLSVATYLVFVSVLSIAATVAVWACFVRARPNLRAHTPGLFAYGVKSWVGGLAAFGVLRMDQLVLLRVAGETALGYYAVAVSLAALPLGVSQAIGSRVFGAVAAAEDADVERVLRRYMRLTTAACGAAVLAVAIAVPVAVPIAFGQAFAPSVVPTLVLLPGTLALCLSTTVRTALLALNRPLAGSFAEGVGLVVVAVGLAALNKHLTVTWAAALSTFAYTAVTAINLWFLRQERLRRVSRLNLL